jgi:hypothetical protein
VKERSVGNRSCGVKGERWSGCGRGDYRFPVEEDAAPGYIEVRNVNSNTSADAIAGSGASGGRSGNRRNVVLKSSLSNINPEVIPVEQLSPPPSRLLVLVLHRTSVMVSLPQNSKPHLTRVPL